ncbi:MAG TPA: hypothetical protein VMW83_05615, partial [Spirochaetia bacterium]|nr:hypothetical protein [Spirochaetia bacterium]
MSLTSNPRTGPGNRGLASKGVGILYVLLLPLLFSAGVTLVDSADGVLMLCAYNWAFMKPV